MRTELEELQDEYDGFRLEVYRAWWLLKAKRDVEAYELLTQLVNEAPKQEVSHAPHEPCR